MTHDAQNAPIQTTDPPSGSLTDGGFSAPCMTTVQIGSNKDLFIDNFIEETHRIYGTRQAGDLAVSFHRQQPRPVFARKSKHLIDITTMRCVMCNRDERQILFNDRNAEFEIMEHGRVCTIHA